MDTIQETCHTSQIGDTNSHMHLIIALDDLSTSIKLREYIRTNSFDDC